MVVWFGDHTPTRSVPVEIGAPGFYQDSYLVDIVDILVNSS